MIQGCDDDDDPTGPNGDGNISEVAQNTDNLSDFVSNLENTELLSSLEAEGPLTVFAPTNSAFDQLPNGFLSELSNEELSEVLSYHIAEADIATDDLEAEQTITTQAGSLFVTSQNGTVSVNDSATVEEANIEASNGNIHTIDRVVLPDAYLDVAGIVTKRYNLQALQDSLVQAELVDTLKQDTQDGYTVFAPTNSAFENADLGGQELANVLRYHVLPEGMTTDELSSGSVETASGETLEVSVDGENVTLTDQAGNSAAVTTVDLEGTNGVVHIIDSVLMPSGEQQNQ